MTRRIESLVTLTGEEVKSRYEGRTESKGCVLGMTKSKSEINKKWDEEHLPFGHTDTYQPMSDEYFGQEGDKTVEGLMEHLGIEKEGSSFTVSNGMEFWAKETGTLNRNKVKGGEGFQYDRETLCMIQDFKTLYERLKRIVNNRAPKQESPSKSTMSSPPEQVLPRKRTVSMVFERMTQEDKDNALARIGQCITVESIARAHIVTLRQCRHDIQVYFPANPGMVRSELQTWAETLSRGDSDADHIEDCLDLLMEWCGQLHEGIVKEWFTISDVERRIVMPDALLNLQYVLLLSKYMTLFCSRNKYNKIGDHWDLETGRIKHWMKELVDELDKVEELDVSLLRALLRPEQSPIYRVCHQVNPVSPIEEPRWHGCPA